MNKSFTVLGLMSGTSLDGLDIAMCEFQNEDEHWSFKILATECYTYDASWRSRLRQAMDLSKEELSILSRDIAKDYSYKIKEFLFQHKAESAVDLISSHGQTIHHDPTNGVTLQIGNAAIIAAETGIDTLADLRIQDVALGGQGAPIVPMGEWHLFPEFDQLINIGGISNITKMNRTQGEISAYDICPANGLLNHLVSELDLAYDKDGEKASSGSINDELLNQLNEIGYYSTESPKTLDASFALNELMPIIDKFQIPLENKLRTAVEHIAIQISNNLEKSPVLLTGGGALNTFLVERIKLNCPTEIVLPSNEIIEYKEAIIMAFLGLLSYLNLPNIFASVTGASKDHSSGLIYRA